VRCAIVKPEHRNARAWTAILVRGPRLPGCAIEEPSGARFAAPGLGYTAPMKGDVAGRQIEGLLRRITGESDARDALARVGRELRRRHGDLGARRGRQRAAARALRRRGGAGTKSALR
jgi:hypothetical protein